MATPVRNVETSATPDRFVTMLAGVGSMFLGMVLLSWPAVAQDEMAKSKESAVDFELTSTVARLDMIVRSSRILTVEGRIPKYQSPNEDILTATPVSENKIQIYAKAPGTTQINLWDTNEKLYTVDVTIVADAREVEGILSSQLPHASLRVMPLKENAIISGTVTGADDVDRAVAITEQFYATVINNIRVVGVQQVLLHTKLMEVSRTKLRDLGVDFSIGGSGGNLVRSVGGGLSELTTGIGNPLSATSQVVSGDFNGFLAALRKDDLVKLLAEPTIVATHGRPARFVVGGKVPYIVPGGNGQVTVAYEEYGTSVDFLPFVVGPGRIRLEVRPEVSEPDASRSIVLNGANVTAFTSRYAETAVEMQAGQTFAIAGLLQGRIEASTRKVPLLGEMPYVGSLFRRVTEKRNDVELLITVTPEFVDAMEPHEVPCGGPGLSTISPSDKELYCKGYIEVPNLYGDCGCPGGMSTEVASPYDMPAGQPTMQSGSVQYNPIVPGEAPQMVGPGVTIEAPR